MYVSQPFIVLSTAPHVVRACITAWVGLAMVLAACSPEIVSYQAVPRRLCPGGSTLLRWQVKGSAALSADPSLPGVGAVGSADSARFIPTQTTVFTLTATRLGKTKFARQEVSLLDSASPRMIVDTTGVLGSDSVQAVAHLDTAVWDSHARVAEVYGRSGRPLVALHGGRQTVIPGDATGSSTLAGTTLGSDWVIHAPLRPGETIGDPSHSPPARLRIAVRFTCAH